VNTPFQAPNTNAVAERIVRRIKKERPDRMIPTGPGPFSTLLRSLWCIIIAGEIVKGAGIPSSRVMPGRGARVGLGDVRGSGGLLNQRTIFLQMKAGGTP
jgi:hypothetical protein